MTSTAREKFTPHEGHFVHRHGSLEAHPGDRIGQTEGRGGAADASHGHM